jgi:hypothetical protein
MAGRGIEMACLHCKDRRRPATQDRGRPERYDPCSSAASSLSHSAKTVGHGGRNGVTMIGIVVTPLEIMSV